jgi:hypothetical protein
MGVSSPHFSEQELACKGTNCNLDAPPLPVRGCGQNHCDQELVDGLEAFRAKALEIWCEKTAPGAAATFRARGLEPPFPGVAVHDAYRCVKHNAGTTGAVSDSQHSNGTAADLSVIGLTSAELEQCALAVPMFAAGGIGRDDVRDMIHVDHRPTVARWCYYKQADGSVKWGPYEAPAAAILA